LNGRRLCYSHPQGLVKMTAILDRLPTWRIGRFDVTAITKETAREVAANDLQGLAAEMAHHSILAIFPFLLFLAGLTAMADEVLRIDNMSDRIIEQAAKVLPEDATSLSSSFVEEVVDSDGSGAIGLGLLGALWAGSAATGSAMKGLNRIYGVDEKRSMIRRKLVAVGLTVAFGGSLLAAAVSMSAGRLLASWAGDGLGWEAGLKTATGWGLWPLSIVLIVLTVALLYRVAPCREQRFRWVAPGALAFAAGWVVASGVFTFYISNFGSYNRTYGSLAAVIILLVWLYWSSFLLLLGGQLNAVFERKMRRDSSGPKRRPGGSRAQP
jgi:membrane protein